MNNIPEKKSAEFWIEKLELQKHPEGGWFREVYRSESVIPEKILAPDFDGSRNLCTSIYYLLNGEDVSALHRIKSDELWHFYTGDSTIEIVLLQNGAVNKMKLGSNFEQGDKFQVCIPKNTWFGARLTNKNGFVLAGCTVSPGFHFDDFELAGREVLKEYSRHEKELLSFSK